MASRRSWLRSYSFKKYADSRGSLGPEARAIRRPKGARRNVYLPNVNQAMQQTTPRSSASVDLLRSSRTESRMPARDAWARWLGKPLSSGAYGSAFMLNYSGEVKRQLDNALATATFTMQHKPPPGGPIVVKIAGNEKRATSRSTRDAFAKDSLKESSWHRYLSRAACVSAPGLARPTCPAEFVPAFYWSGMVNDTVTGRRFYITVMAVAKGVTVSAYTKKRALTAATYVNIERSVVTLWLAGVAHSDFHRGNQLVDPATNKITIIDFGMSMGLDGSIVASLKTNVARAIADGVRSLGELWRSSKKSKYGLGIQRYANQVMIGREQKRLGGTPNLSGNRVWFNPDGHVLRTLYNRLSAHERAKVPVVRRAVWGVTAAPGADKVALLAAAAATRLPTRRSPKRYRVSRSGQRRRVAGRRSTGTSSRSSRSRSYNNMGLAPMNINSGSRYTGSSSRSSRSSRSSSRAGGSRASGGSSSSYKRIPIMRHIQPPGACGRGMRYDAIRRLCVAAAVPLPKR